MGDYEEYLELLLTGLRERKKSIIGVFKEWDHIIFPNTDSSIVRGPVAGSSTGLKRAMEMLDKDSEDENGCEAGDDEGGETGHDRGDSDNSDNGDSD
jgi:hypothetical protein